MLVTTADTVKDGQTSSTTNSTNKTQKASSTEMISVAKLINKLFENLRRKRRAKASMSDNHHLSFRKNDFRRTQPIR